MQFCFFASMRIISNTIVLISEYDVILLLTLLTVELSWFFFWNLNCRFVYWLQFWKHNIYIYTSVIEYTTICDYSIFINYYYFVLLGAYQLHQYGKSIYLALECTNTVFSSILHQKISFEVSLFDYLAVISNFQFQLFSYDY